MQVKSISVRTLTLTVALVAVGLLTWRPAIRPAPTFASGVGPTIAVGAPSMNAGKVQVPVETRGTGFVPYSGFSVHLRWDPAVFALDGASEAGGPFDGALCLGPTASGGDADGGGTILTCAVQGDATISSAGLLATFSLAPKGNGCSQLHLTTLGPPDGGDSTTGTYTMENEGVGESVSPAPQVNAYIDGAADATGVACGANAQPTPVRPGLAPSQPAATAIPPEAITPAPGGNGAAQPGATPPASLSGSQETPGAAVAGTSAALTTSTTVGTLESAGSPTDSQLAARATSAANSNPTVTSAQANKSDGGGSNTGLIIGVVVGVVAVAAAGAGGLWYLRLRSA